jgi:hypothetical protein
MGERVSPRNLSPQRVKPPQRAAAQEAAQDDPLTVHQCELSREDIAFWNVGYGIHHPDGIKLPETVG